MRNSFEGPGTSTENLKKAREALDSNAELQEKISRATSAMEVRAAVLGSFDPPIDPKSGIVKRMTLVESATLLEAIRRWNKAKGERISE